MPAHQLAPAAALFTNNVTLSPGQRVLLLHIDDAPLARWTFEMVGPDGAVVALHTSHRALHQLSTVSDITLSTAVYPSPSAHGPADIALLDLPKGRAHVHAYLWMAAQTLRPGGHLYLAGPNKGGIKSAIKDAADLFGSAPVLAYKQGHRLAIATRPDTLHLPADWAESAPWQTQMRSLHRPDGPYTLITMPGIFSWDHLDEGSALLLDHLGVEPETDVLDIGCGYGILGLAAARAGARVTLVDDNLLAVRCAAASVRANDLAERCTVLPSDITQAVQGQQFDLVLSNPPFHEDFETTTAPARRIVVESFDVLRPGGRLRVVANRFLPYDTLLRDTFGSVRTIAQTGRFRVLESTRPPH